MEKLAALDRELEKDRELRLNLPPDFAITLMREANRMMYDLSRSGNLETLVAGTGPDSALSWMRAVNVMMGDLSRNPGALNQLAAKTTAAGAGSVAQSVATEATSPEVLAKSSPFLNIEWATQQLQQMRDALDLLGRTGTSRALSTMLTREQVDSIIREIGSYQMKTWTPDWRLALSRIAQDANGIQLALPPAGGTYGAGRPIYGPPLTAINGTSEGGPLYGPGFPGGGGEGGGGWGGLLGAIFGGGGGGGGGFLSSLLWGGGSGLPFLGGLAGVGSLGSFAGFGPEHFLMTGVGLGGSLAGAGLGAGLLGLGALGTMTVGMGTNMAGFGQAVSDIRNVVQAQNALSQAVAVYGKNSRQAIAAQNQLNYVISGFAKVARPAVLHAAALVQQFHKMFDQLTGLAEKVGAQIASNFLKAGMKFLPTIGHFAFVNMKILKQGLQPFFKWLTSSTPLGGLGIFKTLEREFTSNMPTGVHMMTQAFELFAKTVDVASHYLGGLLRFLDKFFTKYNSAQGFAKWSLFMNKLIGLFHVWWGLVKILAKDIYQLFHADAGTGKAIVQYLTQMLTKLHQWEMSTRGQKALHNLFVVHKNEILALLRLIPPLVKAFGRIYMTVSPPLVRAMTAIISVFAKFLNLIVSNPLGAWIVGLTMIALRLRLLQGPLSAVIGLLARWAALKVAAMIGTDAGVMGKLAGALGAFGGSGKLGQLLGKMGVSAGESGAGSVAGSGAATAVQEAIAGGGAAAGAETVGGASLLGLLGGSALGLGAVAGGGYLLTQFLGGITNREQHSFAMGAPAWARTSASNWKRYIGMQFPSWVKSNNTSGLSAAGMRSYAVQHHIYALELADYKHYLANYETATQRWHAVVAQVVGENTSAFGNLAKGSQESLAKMIHSMNQSVTQAAKWKTEMQIAIKKGANPEAIINLANTDPQELAKMVKASRPQLVQFSTLFLQHMLQISHAGKQGTAQFVLAVQYGIKHGQPSILNQAANLVQALGGRLGLAKYGGAAAIGALRLAIIHGLASSVPSVRKGALNLARALHMNLKGTGYNIGFGFGVGIQQGIEQTIASVSKAGGQLATGIILAARHVGQIHSPSQVMRRIGHDLAEGLRLGLLDKIPALASTTTTLAKAIIAGFGKLKTLRTDTAYVESFSYAMTSLSYVLKAIETLPSLFKKLTNIPELTHHVMKMKFLRPMVHGLSETFLHLGHTKKLASSMSEASSIFTSLTSILTNLVAVETLFAKNKHIAKIPGLSFLANLKPMFDELAKVFQKMPLKQLSQDAGEVDAIVNNLTSAIAAIAGIKNVNSAMFKAGENLMLGFLNGLTHGLQLVLQEIQRASYDIAQAMKHEFAFEGVTGRRAPHVGSLGGGNMIIVNNNISTGLNLDSKQVVRELWWKMRPYMKGKC